MERKEDTPKRVARRNYEQKHKQKRDAASKVWGTSLPTELAEEINDFCSFYGIHKTDIIKEGYNYFKEKIVKEVKKNE